jgi:hypothetical protein
MGINFGIMKETDEILQALVAKEKDLETKVKELKDAESELAMVKAAIKALSPSTLKTPIHINLSASEVYKAHGTWKEKIKYAVKSKGQAGIKAISEFICQMEPELDPSKVYSAVAVNVGDMVNKQGSLKTKKMNGKNMYYFHE